VFRLLDEQRGRAGEMFDAIIGGKPTGGAVRFYAVEVVYCVAPAPLQDEHDDIVRKGMAQFAVLCSESRAATRWYFFNGDAAKFLHSIRTSEYGNSEVTDVLFKQRLAEHGDLGAIAVATAPERAALVLDRPMFPPRCTLLRGHAWALGGEHPVIHGGPSLPAVTVRNQAGAAVVADEETVKKWLESDTEDVAGLERCFVATLCERGGTGEHSDREPQQKSAALKAAELGCDARIRMSRRLQSALNSPFMRRLGTAGWAADTRRPEAEMRALLNPASAPDAQPLGATRSRTGAEPAAAAAKVATARNPALNEWCQPPPGGEKRHPLVTVYKGVDAPTFRHGKKYAFGQGEELPWAQCGENYTFETMVIGPKTPEAGILLRPIHENWSEFRVFAGEVVVILPGFRAKWITGNEGEAEKDYSYFLVGDGEVRTANRKDLKGNKDSGVEGTTELHCDLCSAECWGESYHLQEGCAEALGVKAAAKRCDVCPTCRDKLMSGDGAKDVRVQMNPPERQAYARAWREDPYDAAVSASFYPPFYAPKPRGKKQLAVIAAPKPLEQDKKRRRRAY
jgi:hypothetical protein